MDAPQLSRFQDSDSAVEDGVYCPSPEQLKAAEERLLEKCGFSRQELEDQARRGKFKTEAAKRAWYCLP